MRINALAGLLALGALCGCSPPECNVTNCADGCCSTDDKCIVSNSDLYCGLRAQTCQSCSALGRTCSMGVCGSKCNASTCSGCCLNDTCLTGSTSSACGAGGAQCAICSGATSTCSNYQCKSCRGGGTSCSSDSQCCSGDCSSYSYTCY